MKNFKKIDDAELDNLWEEFSEVMYRPAKVLSSVEDLISNYMEQFFKNGKYEFGEIYTSLTEEFGIESNKHFETIKMIYYSYIFKFQKDILNTGTLIEKMTKFKQK